jgi:DNA-binding GntR family transcriptional regulator
MKAAHLLLPQPKRSDSLAIQVFGILKEAIFAGKFQPGEALRELHLARNLEVSQATIREALVQLVQAGLVVRTQNRGTAVTSFTKEEVRDRLAMRIALEELAFVKAAALMTKDDFVALEGAAKAIEDAIKKRDCTRMTTADMGFHHAVWELADSPVMLRTLDQLTTPLFAFMSVLHANDMHDLQSGKPHAELIDALRSGKPDMIRRAIRNHIEGSYSAFLESDSPSLDLLGQSADVGARRLKA